MINKGLSRKVLFLGVSMKTKGGMTAVLVSYRKYIKGMKFAHVAVGWQGGEGVVCGAGYGKDVVVVPV